MTCATGLVGNVDAVNIRTRVEDLITFYERLGCIMSFKMHFLPGTRSAVSDKDNGRFYDDISATEKRYKGKWRAAMLPYWTITAGR